MKNRPSIFFFALAILLLGCYPDGPDNVDELDVVLTNFKEYDFQAKATYAMPNRIVKITGNIVEGEDPVFMPDVTANSILQMIEINMTDLGWQRVEIDENPDLLLAPGAWETTNIFYWYDYYYWWYGGYYPYWGCCYGYYPPAYVSSYTTGTLIMTLIDPDVISGSGSPISQWTGAINGVLSGVFDSTRVSRAVDQAFEQSPYLKTN
jgi:hypothetical protein